MNIILSLGFVFLIGILASRLMGKIKFPSVVAYLLVGILIGPEVLSILSEDLKHTSGFISNVVLGLIAFGLGQNFHRESFRKIGKPVLWISLLGALIPWFVVTLGILLIVKVPFYIAFLLGAISTATDPAATVMVIRETKSKGDFTNIIMGVVAVDDAWGLIIFAVTLAVSKIIAFHSPNVYIFKAVLNSFVEIGGAFILGGVVAYCASIISRYLRSQTELFLYTLGFIFLTVGMAIWLNLSVLLSAMFLGVVLVNINHTSFKFFEVLRQIELPLYMLFFVLAGASLDFSLLLKIGILGLVYVMLRTFGKVIGSTWAGYIVNMSSRTKKYLGFALLPQAGVALGCALIVSSELPQAGEIVLTTIVATTVVFELIGPLCTRFALHKAGDTG